MDGGMDVPGGSYLRVRKAVMVDGMSIREASRVSICSRMATMPMFRLGRSAWMATPSSKFRLKPVQKGHDDGIAGLDAGHQVLPAGTVHGPAAGLVGEDQVPPDAVGIKLPQLRLQVLGVVVGLADPGVAVGYWSHGVQKTGVFERGPNPPPAILQRVCNNYVQE